MTSDGGNTDAEDESEDAGAVPSLQDSFQSSLNLQIYNCKGNRVYKANERSAFSLFESSQK